MGFTDLVIQQLSQPLDVANVAHRKQNPTNPNSPTLSYIEGYYAINTLNRIFGFDGWRSEILTGPTFYPSIGNNGAWAVNIRIHAGDGYHDDGALAGVNGATADSSDTAYKACITDALKRAARYYGDQFGNGLYDKDSDLHTPHGNAARPAIPGAAPTFQRPTGNTQAAAPRASNSGGTISAAQVAFIGRLGGTDADAMARFGVATLADVPKGSAASAWIDELKAGGSPAPQRAPQRPAVDADVPF